MNKRRVFTVPFDARVDTETYPGQFADFFAALYETVKSLSSDTCCDYDLSKIRGNLLIDNPHLIKRVILGTAKEFGLDIKDVEWNFEPMEISNGNR